MATKAKPANASAPATPADNTITIGGKKRRLRFGWRAIRAIESETGIGYGDIFIAIQGGRLGYLVELVWAGLLHLDDPEITVEKVEGWFDAVDDLALIVARVDELGAESLKILDPQKKKAD